MGLVFWGNRNRQAKRSALARPDLAELELWEHRFAPPSQEERDYFEEFSAWRVGVLEVGGQPYRVFGKYFRADEDLAMHIGQITELFTHASLGNEPIVTAEVFDESKLYFRFFLRGTLVREDYNWLELVEEHVDVYQLYSNGPYRNPAENLPEEILSPKLTE